MQNKFRTNNHWFKNRKITDKFSVRVFFSRVSHQAVSDAMDRNGGAVR